MGTGLVLGFCLKGWWSYLVSEDAVCLKSQISISLEDLSRVLSFFGQTAAF